MIAARKRFGRRSRAARRATAAVELALTVPMVIAFVLGGIDLGRFAYTYVAVTNSARAAAGYAAMTPVPIHYRSYWNHKYSECAVNEMCDFNAAKITVALPVTTIDSSGFQRIRAQVSYPFQTLVNWTYIFPIPHEFTLTRAVEMRVIRY